MDRIKAFLYLSPSPPLGWRVYVPPRHIPPALRPRALNLTVTVVLPLKHEPCFGVTVRGQWSSLPLPGTSLWFAAA